MRRDGLFRETAKQQLDDAIHATRMLAKQRTGVPPAYERLLRHVLTRSSLLHPSDRAIDNAAYDHRYRHGITDSIHRYRVT